MRFVTIAGRRYAQFDRLVDAPGLVHAFSTRPEDVSMRVDARSGDRAARRAAMASDLGLAPGQLSVCVQVHRTRIARVDAAEAPARLEECDGAATNVAGRALMSFSADCPLVLVYDPRRRAIGVVHASWRCTVAELAQQLVQTLRDTFGSDPSDLLAGIGPSAGPCCYEVKDDVRSAAAHLDGVDAFFPRRDGRMYFDLWTANRHQLRAAGLPDGNIETAGLCTMCHVDTFYSFRKEGAGCGHFGLMAAVAP